MLRVTQSLVPTASQNTFGPDYEMVVEIASEEAVPCESDGRSVSALSWVSVTGGGVRAPSILRSVLRPSRT